MDSMVLLLGLSFICLKNSSMERSFNQAALQEDTLRDDGP